jgi:hypothetical protein
MRNMQKMKYDLPTSVYGKKDQRPIVKKAVEVANQLYFSPRYRIVSTNPQRTRSFNIPDQNGNNIKINKRSGVYCYWVDNKPLYVGVSGSCLRKRVTYFVASVWDDPHPTEKHNGANVYRMMHGTGNFENVMFSYQELERDLKYLEMVEKVVCDIYDPFYKKYMSEYAAFRAKEISDNCVGLEVFS